MKTKLAIITIGALAAALLASNGCGGFVKDNDFNKFKASLGNTTITIYPAVVRVGNSFKYEQPSAAELAKLIQEEKLATVTISSEEVRITNGWHTNQAKMLEETSRDLSAHIAAHPIQTDYALLPEYLGGKGGFGGIQCNIVDKHGTPAFALVMNSHNKTFAKISPKSAADCTKILLTGLREHLATAHN